MTVDLDQITKARFIKLGRGAENVEQQCIASGKASIGFWSTRANLYQLAVNRQWEEYKKLVLREIVEERGFNHMGLPGKKRHATSGTNQVCDFFESDEATLWITFHGQSLYYGVFDSSVPQIEENLGGVTRKVIGGWANKDIKGDPLFIDSLSGILTQVRIFRGTSCSLKDSQLKYLKRRLSGVPPEHTLQIQAGRRIVFDAVSKAIKELHPTDFEVLVEILFSRSWRRIDRAGGSLQFVDITFVDPMRPHLTLGVQVKSRTSHSQINDYLTKEDIRRYDHFYFVFHTLEGAVDSCSSDGKRVTLVDCAQLANLVIDSGLTHWLTEKSR